MYQLYGNGLIAGIAFAEELLPGLDIIPTATIAWVRCRPEGTHRSQAASSPSFSIITRVACPRAQFLENTDLGQKLNEKAPPTGGSAWPSPGAGDGMKRADGRVVEDDEKR